MWLAAQIFAGFSGVLLVYSLCYKTKEDMLKVQAADAVCAGISSLLLGGWTAVALDVLSVIRNLYVNGKKRKQIVAGVWCAAGFLAVLWDKLGILPLAASAVYTVTAAKCSLGWTKVALALDASLWSFYDFGLGAYPLIVSDCITIIIILVGAGKGGEGNKRLFSLRL